MTRRIAVLTLLPCLLAGAAEPAGAADKIKVLILDGQHNHGWKATTPVMRAILENCGRFSVDVATSPPQGKDLSGYRPKFRDYGVVLSNYSGDSWPEATRKDFLDFVKGGGGVVIVHGADNAFPKWKEFNEIIGLGGWGNRSETEGVYIRCRDGKIVRDASPGRAGSHGTRHECLIVTRKPDHPITKGLPEQWRHAKDEIYDRLRGPAKNLEVLATVYSDPATRGSGEHEPALFTIKYGKGRIFHTILGHGTEAMQGLGFQVTLQRGTEWAATGKVTMPAVSAARLPADRAAHRDPSKIAPVAAAKEPQWITLFDGKTLDGWVQKNGTATYRVEDGAIVGRTTEGSPNSFLCTKRNYRDFDLRFEVDVDPQLNSGVQIRSQTKGGTPEGRVNGPQVEIEVSGAGGAEAGYLYGEAAGGWMTPKEKLKPHKHFKDGQWNAYRVLAKGPNIKVWINGVLISDLTDQEKNKTHPEGFIGLQVHGIGRGKGPFEVSWRDIRIRDFTRR